MELFLLVVVGIVVVWLVVHSRNANAARIALAQETIREEQRRALQIVEIDVGDENFRNVRTFDFETMTAQTLFQCIDYTMPREAREKEITNYAIRVREGRWESKLTRESWGLALRAARSQAKGSLGYDDAQEAIRKLGDGPTWVALDEELSARLNTAHQRYLRQG